MVRYILTKIDNSVIKDKRFFNGKTKKFFGNKSVVLTEDNLDEMIDALVDLYPEPAEELESLRKDTLIKLRKVLE